MIDTQFSNQLASSEPVPGGGGASAYTAALAAALGAMVVRLTQGKKKFLDRDEQYTRALEQLESLRAQCHELIAEDARVFKALSDCWRMPTDTAEQQAAKKEAQNEALIYASEVPLRIVRLCRDMLYIDEYLRDNCSRLVVSDVGASAALAGAAARAAVLNVYINIRLMDDKTRAEAFCVEAQSLKDEVERLSQETYSAVVATLTNE